MRGRVLAICSFLVAAGVTLAQTNVPATPKPKLDRSGETRLRGLFEHWGRVENVHINVSRMAKAQGDYLLRRGDVDFYRAADRRWRFQAADSSNGPYLAVGGKNACLLETGGIPKTLSDPVFDLDKILAVEGLLDCSTPMMYLLEGPKGFDKFVLKDFPVTLSSKDGVDLIEFKAPVGSIYRLTVKGNSVLKGEVTAFGSTDLPGIRDTYAVDLHPVFQPWYFDTTPAPGFKVDDRRTKKG